LWLVGLFVASFFIVFCRAVGHFLIFLFLLGWLCKLFDKALVAAFGLCGFGNVLARRVD